MEVVENKKDGGVEAARRWGGKMMNNVGLWVVSFQLVGRGGKMKTLVGIPALVENPPHPSKKMNIGVNAYSQKLRRNLGGGAGLGRRGREQQQLLLPTYPHFFQQRDNRLDEGRLSESGGS